MHFRTLIQKKLFSGQSQCGFFASFADTIFDACRSDVGVQMVGPRTCYTPTVFALVRCPSTNLQI